MQSIDYYSIVLKYRLRITVPRAYFERLQDMEKLKHNFSCRKRNFYFRGLTVVSRGLKAGHSDQGWQSDQGNESACRLAGKKVQEFQNWLMIKLVPSFKLRTRHF